MSKEKRLRWARATIATHKARGFMVTLGSRQLYDMVEDINNCSICGCELNRNGGKLSSISPTLDRVDNEMFINKDNIQIVCHRCNRLNGTMLMSEFVSYCNIVSDNFKCNSYVLDTVNMAKEEQVKLIEKQKIAIEEFEMARHLRGYYEDLYLENIVRDGKRLNRILDDTEELVRSMRNRSIPEYIILKSVIHPSIQAFSGFNSEIIEWAIDKMEKLKLEAGEI